MHVVGELDKGHLAFGAHFDRLHCVRIDDHVCVSQMTCGRMRNMQRIETPRFRNTSDSSGLHEIWCVRMCPSRTFQLHLICVPYIAHGTQCRLCVQMCRLDMIALGVGTAEGTRTQLTLETTVASCSGLNRNSEFPFVVGLFSGSIRSLFSISGARDSWTLCLVVVGQTDNGHESSVTLVAFDVHIVAIRSCLTAVVQQHNCIRMRLSHVFIEHVLRFELLRAKCAHTLFEPCVAGRWGYTRDYL